MAGLKRLRDGQRAPRPAVIGKLKKGAERTEEDIENRRPGQDLHWFRFVPKPGFEKAEGVFTETFGADPAMISGVLPLSTVDECFPTNREARDKSGILLHICDGETMTLWRDEKSVYHNTPAPCTGGCEEMGRLYLEIPELTAAGFAGVVMLETGSGNDIDAVYAALLAIAEKRKGTLLGLRGVPVIIRRVPAMIQAPRTDKQGNITKRVRTEKWLVQLLESPEWAARELERAQDEAQRRPSPEQPTMPWEEEIVPGAKPQVRICPRQEDDEEDKESPDPEQQPGQPTGEEIQQEPAFTPEVSPQDWLKQFKVITDLRHLFPKAKPMVIAEALSRSKVALAPELSQAIVDAVRPLLQPAASLEVSTGRPAAATPAATSLRQPVAPEEVGLGNPPPNIADLACTWLTTLQAAVEDGGKRLQGMANQNMIGRCCIAFSEAWPKIKAADRDALRHTFLSLVNGKGSFEEWNFGEVQALERATIVAGDDNKRHAYPPAVEYIRYLVDRKQQQQGASPEVSDAA